MAPNSGGAHLPRLPIGTAATARQLDVEQVVPYRAHMLTVRGAASKISPSLPWSDQGSVIVMPSTHGFLSALGQCVFTSLKGLLGNPDQVRFNPILGLCLSCVWA